MTEQDRLFWLEVRRALMMLAAAIGKRFLAKVHDELVEFVPPQKRRDAA